MIDVVGHFGTMHSYASVAGYVCEALQREGLLGRVMNLDPAVHDRWAGVVASQGIGTHVLVFAVPHHYLSPFAEQKGKERSAIFISPNTDQMDDEYLRTIAKFGTVIAPSKFCLNAVKDVDDVVLSVLPLGCPIHDDKQRAKRASFWHGSNRLKVAHFTSDHAWPGRKGTEELIAAWHEAEPANASLVIHGPRAIQKPVLYQLADLDLTDEVSYLCAESHGEHDDLLARIYESANLVVAPSRSEGYGMMISGAIVAGVPLLTTCNTGHAEFLMRWPGRWMQTPTPFSGPLAYENGLAPTVEVKTLAASLRFALDRGNLLRMAERAAADFDEQGNWGTWEWALPMWVEKLKDWIEGG